MTGAALLPLPISKEIRALAFPWLACIVVMVLPSLIQAPRFLGVVSVAAYLLGAAALGALSIGREYTDRTLSLLLTLPARRERLLLAKLGVLAVMLLTLWGVAAALLFFQGGLSRSGLQAASVLPVLCALFVAPWLTMACRNAIAGTVFTMAVPGVMMTVGEWLAVAQYGRGPEMEALRVAILWRGTLGLCAIGAMMSWRMFTRLEAIEGPGQDVSTPQWLRSSLSWLPALAGTRTTAGTAPPFTKRNPVWLLVKKELRLQQMTFVVAGLYLLAWVAAEQTAFALLTFFYVGPLALLIGSLASAEERQLGTLEWQVLLPMAAWKQWAVKMGMVMGLTMLLAFGLPAVLFSLNPIADSNPFLRPEPAVVLIALAAGSLYVSSLCTSGLWALLMSLAATFGGMTLVSVAIVRAFAARAGSSRLATGVGFGPLTLPWPLTLLLVAAFIALVQRYALTNHRSADRSAGRVWSQVIVMAAVATAGIIIVAGVQAFRR